MTRIQEFYRTTEPFRRRFGLLRGLWMAVQFRSDYKLARGKPYRVSVPGLPHPVTLRAGTSDSRVFHQLVMDRELDVLVEGTPQFIIDAGANIGLASILLAVRFPAAKVVALEVDQDNFRLLEFNTRPYPQILPRLQALWSERTTLAVNNPLGENWTFQVSRVLPGGIGAVTALGVGDLLDEFGEQRVDLLKLDIEGSEAEVLSRGSQDWVSRVGLLVVELHDQLRLGCTEALESFLRGQEVRREVHGEYVVIRFGAGRRVSPSSASHA